MAGELIVNGVTGNTSDSESEDSRFESWLASVEEWEKETEELDRMFFDVDYREAMTECTKCWAMVLKESRRLHRDWHAKIRT